MKPIDVVAVVAVCAAATVAVIASCGQGELRVQRPAWMDEKPSTTVPSTDSSAVTPPNDSSGIKEIQPVERLQAAVAASPAGVSFLVTTPIILEVAEELAPLLQRYWNGLTRSKRISEELGKHSDVFTCRTDYLLAMWPDLDKAIISGAVKLDAIRMTPNAIIPDGFVDSLRRNALAITIKTPNWLVKMSFTENTGFQHELFQRMVKAIDNGGK